MVGRWILAVLIVVGAGCGGASGPPRFALSGKVTCNSQPVPFGEISFQPDGEKGNSGPGATAPIRNGAYQFPADRGVVAGAHVVRITGFDAEPAAGAAPAAGTEAKPAQPLFPEYVTKTDVGGNKPLDFEVPAAGK